MDSGSDDVSNSQPVTTSNVARSTAVESPPVQSTEEVPPKLSTSGISSWAKNLKIPQPLTGSQDEQSSGNASKSTFARFTGGLGMRPLNLLQMNIMMKHERRQPVLLEHSPKDWLTLQRMQ